MQLLGFFDPSFSVARARRFSCKPLTNSDAYQYNAKLAQRQTFRSFSARHEFSVHAHPVSSTSTHSPARDPFTILFCGRDLFSCAVFKEIHAAKDVWDSLHIATNPDTRHGRRGSRLDISPLKVVGEMLNVPVHTIPADRAAFKKWLLPPPFVLQPDSPPIQNASHLLVTASFGRIIPGSILRRFPKAQRLNVHPSLLPAYRGPAPIQRVLMAGERETGVCVIEMGEVSRRAGKLVDTGSIWAAERMRMPEDANFLQMQDSLAALGGRLLVQVLRDMLSGKAQSKPQEATTLTTPHAPLVTARDSAVCFTSQTAVTITQLERAIGHQRSLVVAAALPDGRGVAIAGLRAIPTGELGSVTTHEPICPGTTYYSARRRSLAVKCADETWLSIEKLQTQDRAMMGAKEWWNGVKGMGWVKDGAMRLGGGSVTVVTL